MNDNIASRWSCSYVHNGEEYNLCLYGTRQEVDLVMSRLDFKLDGEVTEMGYLSESQSELMTNIFRQ